MKKILFPIIVLACVGTLSACAHTQTPSTKSLFGVPVKTLAPDDIAQADSFYDYMQGDLLALEGQPQRSIPDLTRAISRNPNSAYLYLTRANAYAASQQVAPAEEDCLKALELAPELTQAKLLMARLLSVEGKFANAIPMLEQVMRKTPDEKETYPLLAVAYMNTQQYAKSIQVMKRLLVIDPDAMIAYYYMGAVYGTYLKQPGLALQMYQKVLVRDPRNTSVYNAIAQLYVDKGDIPRAIATLNEAFENGVDDVTLKLRLSSLYYQNKNYAKAAEILEQVLQRTPNSNKVRYYLGVIYEESGDFDKARGQFNQISSESSFFKDAMLRQSLYYYRNNQITPAIGVLQMAIMRAPKVQEFYPLLAMLYEETGNMSAARATLERGSKALPKDSTLLYALAVVMDRMKDTDGALRIMHRVVELDPANVSAINYIGYTYTERGTHLDEAEELLLTAAQLQPRDGYILDSLGWLYYKKNDYVKSQSMLEQAIRMVPNEPVVYKHLGDLYAAMGRSQDAIRCYEHAVALLKTRPSEEVNLEKLQEDLDALQK